MKGRNGWRRGDGGEEMTAEDISEVYIVSIMIGKNISRGEIE